MKNLSAFSSIDPAFFLDGLFLPRAEKTKAIDISAEWSGGAIRFRGVQLGAVHQSVLLAVCARTGRDGLLIHKDEAQAKQLTFWNLLDSKGDAIDQSIAEVHTSAYSLLQDAGLGTGGVGYKKLLIVLQELQSLTVYRRLGKRGGGMNILSFNHIGDKYDVRVNWRLAQAVLGDHQNIRVSLNERRALKSPVAKILHGWLCAHVWLGQSLMNGRGAAEVSLMRHVWGENDKLPRNAAKSVKARHRKKISLRRTALQAALLEIGQVTGWAVVKDGGKWLISRPKTLPSWGQVEIKALAADAESNSPKQ